MSWGGHGVGGVKLFRGHQTNSVVRIVSSEKKRREKTNGDTYRNGTIKKTETLHYNDNRNESKHQTDDISYGYA